MKICSKCNVEKEATKEFFHSSKGGVNGLRSDCKKCKNKSNKIWTDSKGSEYYAWKNMRQRCYNENNNSYENYGERKITVSNEWLESYETFIKDMGRKPSKNHTIERVDNDKEYSKDNCVWATRSEQSINRRRQKSNTSGYSGIYPTSNNKWQASISINGKRHHLGTFENLEDAIVARKAGELKYWNKQNTL